MTRVGITKPSTSWATNVCRSERWFRDGQPHFGAAFTRIKTDDRSRVAINILERHARSAVRLGQVHRAAALTSLTAKLRSCSPDHRCSSAACVKCSRAIQRALSVSITDALRARDEKLKRAKLTLTTLIPLDLALTASELAKVGLHNIASEIFARLYAAGIDRPLIGCVDISFSGRVCQVHLHVAIWSTIPKNLARKLKANFPANGAKRYQRPVHVTTAYDFDFVPYMTKIIRWSDVMRRNRKDLPDLLLALDRVDHSDLIVMRGFQVSQGFPGSCTVSRTAKSRPP